MSQSPASDWELSKSYDVGVQYTYRNLLKDNPYRRRFFRQWLARFDHENVKNYYNYETGASKNKGELAPTEIHYDQVQRMVYSANLPIAVENELFYHLDYIMNREKKAIDILRLKEFFAFCGVDGVYDLENKKHFLMNLDQPYMPKTINFQNWEDFEIDENREMLARMMSSIEEVPNNKLKIEELNFEYNVYWTNAFKHTELYKKLELRLESVYKEAKSDPEAIAIAVQKAKDDGVDLNEYDEEIEQFTKQFNIDNPKAGELDRQKNFLINDEREKLAIAMEKYANIDFLKNPDIFKEYDKNLSLRGRLWDLDMNEDMKDEKKWGRIFIGHDSFETCSNEMPDGDELPYMNRRLIEKGAYNRARFSLMMKNFSENEAPEIRRRYCAIKDWILRDYTMNEINKGEVAKARKIDIPILFEKALRAELEDGLLTRLNFPIRVEKLNDGSGNCKLVLNGYDVEVFDPATINKDLALPKSQEFIEKEASNAEDVENNGASNDDDNFIDFKIHDNDIKMDRGKESKADFSGDTFDKKGQGEYIKDPESSSFNESHGHSNEKDSSYSKKEGSSKNRPYENESDSAHKTNDSKDSSSGVKTGYGNKDERRKEKKQKKWNPYEPGNSRSKEEEERSRAPVSDTERILGGIVETIRQGKAEKEERLVKNRLNRLKNLVDKKRIEGSPLSDDEMNRMLQAINSNKRHIEGLDRRKLLDEKNLDALKEVYKDAIDVMKGIKRSVADGTVVSKTYDKCLDSLKSVATYVKSIIAIIIGLIRGSGYSRA